MNLTIFSKQGLLSLLAVACAFQVGRAQQSSNAQIEQFIFEDCYNYHQAQHYGWSSDYFNLEIASDYVLKGGASSSDQPQLLEVDNFTLTSTNQAVYSEWQNLYDGIEKCNQVLFHLEDIPANSLFRADAKFTRAYNYFHLVTLYGGVPLYLTLHEKISEPITRASVSEVYAQIEKDLTEAVAVLPQKSDIGVNEKYKATKGAALTLLGDVCINQQKWAEAKTYLDQVVASGQYSLMANFADLWLMANEHNSESIFEYEYYSEGANWGNTNWSDYTDNRIVMLSGPRQITSGTTGINAGWGFQNATKSLADFFDANGDVVRKNATIITPEFWTANGATYTLGYDDEGYKSKKYTTLVANTTAANGADASLNYGQNTVKMRYADVLLLLAEAEAHLGNNVEALDYVNTIRSRASLPALSSSLTNSGLLEAIFTERTLEFALEGKRYRDVVRCGKADQFFGPLGYNSATKGLWPIPASVIFENPGIVQNAGYDNANDSEYSNFVQISNVFPPAIKFPWIINSPSELKPSESLFYSYNYALEDSVLKYKFSYSYDANNLLTQYTQNWYNRVTNQWQDVYQEKYEYNNSKQLVLSVSLKKNITTWDTLQTRIISYPEPNIVLDSLKSNYYGTNKTFISIYVNRYTWDNSQKSYTKLITQWTNDNGQITQDNIVNIVKNQLTYDGQNNISKDCEYFFSTDWNLKSETNYTYYNNLLVEKSSAGNKTTYSYANNNLSDTIKTYKDAFSTTPSSGETITRMNQLQINTSLVSHPLIGNLRRDLSRMFYVLGGTTSLKKPLEVTGDRVQISPNPSNGLVTISGIETVPTKLDIYNISGVKVGSEEVTSQSQTLNLTYLQSGSYVLKVANTATAIKFMLRRQ